MEPIIIILGFLVLALAAVLFFVVQSRKKPVDEGGMLMLQQQMAELVRTMDTKLGESSKATQESLKYQMGESQRLVREINDAMSKSLLELTREQMKTNEATGKFVTIAEQLANLEKVLTHQKQRGNLGEASLELILSNILPPGTYKMQYEFADKAKVDAVIVTKEGMIPVDAKFSLDNYSRIQQASESSEREELEKEFRNDLKKRIDETAKYVRPDEGTLPFAFMFIPAEAIYYDLLINEVGAVKVNTRNLIDYAYQEKKVVIVSPTTFAAYLQSVLYGFKAFKIEETAKDIIKRVDDLRKHLSAYDQYHEKLGNSLATTVGHYNASSKEFKKIDKDVLRLTGEAAGVEVSLLDKPSGE
ncbi:MAG: DNA recombination protein RmuC [Candidatus Vogelbacteria bacterium CG10_big_fil_rev_8_21_14_0_10_51_16]|uniref:DNA recombination protein RmuC n=1 Tax=Candidatus Vogelbacteria bacterium CG10_big_fil_rev_8_21_14_0_10_51_16 TaxID=1975045 RepID=A0A2H0RGF3_9BACT|nr:MAG: DNA recombination protein RmuC [Candidatus Vogelbacteria bacterium CG10_big_fil_rev_8_21_14_0_10_51_16]